MAEQNEPMEGPNWGRCFECLLMHVRKHDLRTKAHWDVWYILQLMLKAYDATMMSNGDILVAQRSNLDEIKEHLLREYPAYLYLDEILRDHGKGHSCHEYEGQVRDKMQHINRWNSKYFVKYLMEKTSLELYNKEYVIDKFNIYKSRTTNPFFDALKLLLIQTARVAANQKDAGVGQELHTNPNERAKDEDGAMPISAESTLSQFPSNSSARDASDAPKQACPHNHPMDIESIREVSNRTNRYKERRGFQVYDSLADNKDYEGAVSFLKEICNGLWSH